MEFVDYEVVPLKDLGEHAEQCEPRHAEFWGLYGISEDGNAYAVGDFKHYSDAEFIRAAIQGS